MPYNHPLDDIYVGDYVVMELTLYEGDEPYVYQVSGHVRKHDGVKAVGCHGLGAGKIIEHRSRPLPRAFGSRVQYSNGVRWVKLHGESWASSTGFRRLDREMGPGWVLLHDAGAES